jgi:predicted Zn-dependent protease with MMP-like domain
MQEFDFEQAVQEALDALPAELGGAISNVSILVEDEPPPGEDLLGLYEGIPLTERTTSYAGVLPDRITIYRGPLRRLHGTNPERLAAEVRHVVWHEVAHHFGIDDERLIELDRY